MSQETKNDVELQEAATKSELLGFVMQKLGSMKKAELEQFVKNFSDAIPDGAAAQNQASVAMKPSAASSAVKEDVEALFDGSDLSEEFKTKTSTLFEAAVNNRVELIRADLEEQFEAKHDDEVKASIDELHKNVDSYLDYVVEQWIENNKVALESNYRTEITENFLTGLKSLFAENYVEVPEDKVDLVGELQEQVSKLQESLETVESKNIELSRQIDEAKRLAVIDELSEGLTDTEIEKLTSLAEGVNFDEPASYKEKVSIIKERYFGKSEDEPTSSTGLINEEASIGSNDEPEGRAIPADMRAFVESISRTVRK